MKYIASCSFGKDSIATIILAHLNNEPLDLIVYCEVMFDENIFGENPIHRDFIYNIAIPVFEKWGYKIQVLRANKTYKDCFYAVCGNRAKQERIGKLRGFPIPFACKINSECKVAPIKSFYKSIKEPVTQYVGIAIDEIERLERLENTNKISLLAKYLYTEKMAFELCEKYNLLSPIYEISNRNGCWFCPNARLKQLAFIKENYSKLWEELLIMSQEKNLVSKKFNREKTFQELDKELEHFIDMQKRQMKLF